MTPTPIFKKMFEVCMGRIIRIIVDEAARMLIINFQSKLKVKYLREIKITVMVVIADVVKREMPPPKMPILGKRVAFKMRLIAPLTLHINSNILVFFAKKMASETIA
jgi:hypothetical protein